jgi:hypothetical protein
MKESATQVLYVFDYIAYRKKKDNERIEQIKNKTRRK